MSTHRFTKPETRRDGKMHETDLIQRLRKPYTLRFGPNGTPIDNPFAFGGGLKNGGLSDEAMNLVRDIFSFDYMGAAEFEFGATPDALRAIAQRADKGQMVAFSFQLKDNEVAKSWRNEGAPLVKDILYAICVKGEEKEVERRVRLAALGKETYRREGKDALALKEVTMLSNSMRGDEFLSENVGWLELDNGFFFFLDKEMYEQTAKLFGIVTAPSDYAMDPRD